MVISMLKIRRPLGRLIFNMGIAIPGKTVFLIETAPRPLLEPMITYYLFGLVAFTQWQRLAEKAQDIYHLSVITNDACQLLHRTGANELKLTCMILVFKYSFSIIFGSYVAFITQSMFVTV